MGKTFFASWALWEKMTFVLACCIVLTIFAGFVKLWWIHRQLRKYSKAPKPINREKSIIRSLSVRKGPKQKKQPKDLMVQKQRSVKEGPNIPFGIRAIESGIEVDGVWISRNNTPAHSRVASSYSSYKSVPQHERNTSTYDVTGHATEAVEGSSVASSSREASQSLMGRSASGDSNGSQPPSSPELAAQQGRRYPPHSYARYEGSTAKHFRNSHTLETRTPTGIPGDRSNRSSGSGSSRTGSNGSNEFTLPEPLRPVVQTRSISNPAFDDALQTHRMSQVAETGHLVPRSRRPNMSTDWSHPVSSNDIHHYSLPRVLTPPPGSASSTNTFNPFTTPTSEKFPSEPNFPSEPKTMVAEGKSPATSTFNRTASESSVLREVNSGFAVLKPGTFDSAAMAAQQQHLRNTSESTDGGERRHSRKLQKKRRTSETSSHYSKSSFEAASDLERGVDVKYSFDQHPPSDEDIRRGSQVEAAGGKYKF